MSDELKSCTKVFERKAPSWVAFGVFLYVIGPLLCVSLAVVPDQPVLYPYQRILTHVFLNLGAAVERFTAGILPGATTVMASLAAAYVLSLLLGQRAVCRRWGRCRVAPWGLDFQVPYSQTVVTVPAGRIAGHRETPAGCEVDVVGRNPLAAAFQPLLIPLAGVEQREAAQTLLDAYQDRSPGPEAADPADG